MNHQKALFKKIVECLDSREWKYEVEDENERVTFTMGINSKLKNCRVIVTASETEIQTFAVSPINASQDVYANVVEFITRANYGLKLGSFEFDYRDGEVRFHTNLSLQETVPTVKEVDRVIVIPMLMLQKYGDGLVKNMLGYGNPEADIAEIENQ